MKIAYILVEDIDSHPGLRNKVLGQTKEWSTHGHEVIIISPLKQTLWRREHFKDIIGDNSQTFHIKKISKFNRIKKIQKSYTYLRNVLKKVNPDLIYTRRSFPILGLKSAYRHACPYVIEINSDDVHEYYLKYKSTGIYNQLFRNPFLKNSAGFVFVTNELSNSNNFSKFQKKYIVIPNGIDCSQFPFQKNTGNKIPNICFIGSPNQKWHGIGKLGILAQAIPDTVIHVIGPTKDEYLSSNSRAYSNMVFHGYLPDIQAKMIVSKMDIGISTLSLFEKNINEACPLKTRQYIAQGVPTIGGYIDPDIPDQPFFLQIPNTQNNVESYLTNIKTFIKKNFRNNDNRISARNFAKKKLDVSIKEKERLSFFETVTSISR
jgi:glycosyltransferase involved in cell wall biosynthesis